MDDITNKFLASIKDKVTQVTYNTWFNELELVKDKDKIIIYSPHDSNKKHLVNNYTDVIEEALAELNINYNEYEITDEKYEKEEVEDNNLNEEYKYYSNFIPKYTFETYVVGESNKFAYSSALSVAKNPGKLYNPLFIYGNSGLGKTHLMHAIGNYIKTNSNKKVLYITTEQFVNDLVLMYNKKGGEKGDNISYIELFRKKYRDIDVLMIDDIQFLGGAIKSQQEFTNTFNSLYDNEKQIIICSDRSVDDLKLLEDRLKTRFNWGLKVNINPPDYDLKVNIIKRKIKTDELIVDLNEEIINYIASNCGSDVRNIEGFITRLSAYQAIMNIPKLTIEDAIEGLREYTNIGLFKPNTIEKIQDEVAKYFGITVGDLKSKKRNALISEARYVAFYLCRTMTEESYEKIGMNFGNRNHATVLVGYEKTQKDMKTNKELGNKIMELKQKINN